MTSGHRPTAVDTDRSSATHAAPRAIRYEPDVGRVRLATRQLATERAAELGGHNVVEDGIDGAVGVDHQSTEKNKPEIVVAMRSERVVHDVGAVGQPQHGEHAYNNGQHLRHLQHAIQKMSDVSLHNEQKAPHGGPIPRLGVTPGDRNLYH